MEIIHDTDMKIGWGSWFWNYMGFDVWNVGDYTLFTLKCGCSLFGMFLFIFLLLWVSAEIELRYDPFFVALRTDREKTLKKKE